MGASCAEEAFARIITGGAVDLASGFAVRVARFSVRAAGGVVGCAVGSFGVEEGITRALPMSERRSAAAMSRVSSCSCARRSKEVPNLPRRACSSLVTARAERRRSNGEAGSALPNESGTGRAGRESDAAAVAGGAPRSVGRMMGSSCTRMA